MSVTIKSIVGSSAATGTGAAGAMLGHMAGFSLAQWAILALVVGMAVVAGAWAALGNYEAQEGVTPEQVKRNRRRSIATLLAQFLFGMVVAAKANGDIWIVIPACLVLGWVGPGFLQWLARRSGMDGGTS